MATPRATLKEAPTEPPPVRRPLGDAESKGSGHSFSEAAIGRTRGVQGGVNTPGLPRRRAESQTRCSQEQRRHAGRPAPQRDGAHGERSLQPPSLPERSGGLHRPQAAARRLRADRSPEAGLAWATPAGRGPPPRFGKGGQDGRPTVLPYAGTSRARMLQRLPPPAQGGRDPKDKSVHASC